MIKMIRIFIIVPSLIGQYLYRVFDSLGYKFNFFLECVISCFRPKFYPKLILQQFLKIGFNSLPVVGLTAIFTGMVLALQSYTGFSRFSAESVIPNVVALSITRELSPVLAGLMVAGRSGAAIAAEIGTMKVTEQIDALKTLNTNFFNYLVTPRVLSLTIAMPLFVTLVDFIGVMGGYLVSVHRLGFNENMYLINTIDFLSFADYLSGVIKATVFGFIISVISCYCGLYSGKGAFGVGSATTNSVVISSILILVSNYILTEIFF